MLTIKKEMAEIYKKDNQGMHNKILVGSAGSGKTTRLIQYMQYLHSVNAPFCFKNKESVYHKI